MMQGFHWHLMLGDHPTLPSHSVEFTDVEQAVHTFVDLVYMLMPDRYADVPKGQSIHNLYEFMIGNYDQNVGAESGDFKIVISPCDGCLNPCVN